MASGLIFTIERSLVPPQMLEGTGHNRSLLERCVLASGRSKKYHLETDLSGCTS